MRRRLAASLLVAVPLGLAGAPPGDATRRPDLPAAVRGTVEAFATETRALGPAWARYGEAVRARAIGDDVDAPFFLLPAVDFDGDGVVDFLDIRWGDETDSPRTTTVARSGADGSRLWRDATDHFSLVQPARVGARGAWGVLRTDVDLQPLLRIAYVALAADGTQVWETVYDSTERMPTFAGVLDNGPDAPQTMLLYREESPLATGVEVGGLPLGAYLSQPALLPLDTGVEQPSGERVLGLRWTPSAGPAGDLTGDGAEDYVVMVPGVGLDPHAGTLQARDATTGAPVWTASGVTVTPHSTSARLTDPVVDQVHLIAVQAFGFRRGQAQPGQDELVEAVTLVEGLEGEVRWTGQASFPDRRGDVDGDGTGDVGLASFPRSADTGRTAVRYTVLTASGEVIWDRELGAVEVGAYSSGSSMAVVDTWPDVTGDGLRDIGFWVRVDTDAGSGSTAGFADGRTGAVRPSVDEDLATFGGSLDGAGDDLVRATVKGGRARFEVYDWIAGGLLLTVEVPSGAGAVGYPYALPLAAGQTCPTLVFPVFWKSGGPADDAFLLRGSDASLVWGVRRRAGTDDPLPYRVETTTHPGGGCGSVAGGPAAGPGPGPGPGPAPEPPKPADPRPAPRPAQRPAQRPRELPATGGPGVLPALAAAALAAGAALRRRGRV